MQAALDARMGPGGEEAALVPAPAATTTQKRRIEPMVTNGHADSSQVAPHTALGCTHFVHKISRTFTNPT